MAEIDGGGVTLKPTRIRLVFGKTENDPQVFLDDEDVSARCKGALLKPGQACELRLYRKAADGGFCTNSVGDVVIDTVEARYEVVDGRLPRWVHCVYAFLAGYFWLPCPICGRKFGGHEKHGILWSGPHEGEGTCWDCRDDALRMSQERGFR